MPEIPEPALAAAERAIIEAATDFGQDDIVAGSSSVLARAALEAAAPILAEHIAQEILAHAEHRHPRDKDHVPTAWDRHFSIAARVAAGAFYTREDELRLAAEAISEGRFIACDTPEPSSHPPGSDRGARIVACPSCGAAAVPGYEMSTSHVARRRAAIAARDIPEVTR